LNKLHAGGVLAKVMVASDKTRLTLFRGSKYAWPVYATLGNIKKDYRRKPSNHAMVLLAYLPVTDLSYIFADEERQRTAEHDLFHACLRKILAPLVKAGLQGVEMMCPDGGVRRVFPILGAYMADYPEQCTVCCCLNGRCPTCTTPYRESGEGKMYPYRDPEETLKALIAHRNGAAPAYFAADGIRAVFNPFWAELPQVNIFRCVTPDIMHELHKFWWDHPRKWLAYILGKMEFDNRYSRLTDFPGLQHFKRGVSHLKMTSMKEHKQMEKTVLAIIANSSNRRLVRACRGLMEFIYLAQLRAHTVDGTVGVHQRHALQLFHTNKAVFQELGCRGDMEHFRIPKLEKMSHYAAHALEHGSADGTNTEAMERLHIDLCKDPYGGGNGHDYHKQMTVWLTRMDAIHRRAAYLDWRERSMPTERVSGACSDDVHDAPEASNPVESDEDADCDGYDSEDEDDDENAIAGTSAFAAPLFRIAKRCPHPRTTVECLIAEHGASQFVPALALFIQTELPDCPVQPSADDRFDVFHQVRVLARPNPYVYPAGQLERIRASRAVPKRGRTPARPGYFDPALLSMPHEDSVPERLHRQ
jgi:hypothetical protein